MLASQLLTNAIVDWLGTEGIILNRPRLARLELATDKMITDLGSADNPIVEAIRLTNNRDGRLGYSFGHSVTRQDDGSYFGYTLIKYDDGSTSLELPADFST